MDNEKCREMLNKLRGRMVIAHRFGGTIGWRRYVMVGPGRKPFTVRVKRLPVSAYNAFKRGDSDALQRANKTVQVLPCAAFWTEFDW